MGMVTPVPSGAIAPTRRARVPGHAPVRAGVCASASPSANGGIVRHYVARAHAMRCVTPIADAKPMRLLMSRDVPCGAAEVTASYIWRGGR